MWPSLLPPHCLMICQQPLWWAKMRVVAMAMRVVGNKEGEGSMAIAKVNRMVGKQQ